MSNILTALVTYLDATSGVTSLISARIYPEKMPPGSTDAPTVMPCMTYQLIDEPVITTHGNEQLYMAKIQLDAWGGSYKSAHAVADALQAALHGYRGLMGSVWVGGVFRERKTDDPDPDLGLNRVSQDYVFNYT